MAIGLQNKTGASTPDADYPDGRITDGATPVSRLVYDDFHQFFAKLLREASITANNLPENESDGHQYIEALDAKIQTFVDALLDAAPGALDTLNELAAALGDDPNFAATTAAALATKLEDTDAVLNGGNTGAYTKIKTKMIQIGDWNMDSDFSKSVAHGVTLDAIRSVSVLIKPDSGSSFANERFNLVDGRSSGTSYTQAQGGWQVVNTNIVLSKLISGFFDSADFDSTSFNRGWITITYEE